MENSTENNQDIQQHAAPAAVDAPPAPAQSFDQTNPESSQPVESKGPVENPVRTAAQTTDDVAMESPTETTLDQMTLDQKKELLQKYDHTPFIKVGAYCDAADTTQNFLLSKIVEVDGTQVLVNFDGWSSKWNSWHRISKIFPFRTKSKGYSGQKKIAIRNQYTFSELILESNYQKVNLMVQNNLEGLSAQEFTQWMSGELFIYVDCLLGDTYMDESVLPKIDLFMKAVLRLIVCWLAKIPQMSKILEEMEAINLIFLVDPKAAIVEAAPEVMETLGKLFGTCVRGMRYFSFYDQNQVDPHVINKEVEEDGNAIIPNTFGVVVQDFTTVDFLKKRFQDDTKYTELVARGVMRDRKDLQYGQVCNWVQYFAQLGGFDAVVNLLEMNINQEKAVKAPFQMISQVTRPFRQLNLVLEPEFAKAFSTRISDIIVKRLSTLSEQDVKICNKDQVDQIMIDLNQVLSIGMVTAERAKIIELTELKIGLRFLKSTNLEKRVKGLQDIRYMIDRVHKTHQLANYNKRQQNNQWNTSSLADNDMDSSKIPSTGYLTNEVMLQWLQQNKVLEIIFGQGAHIEIVKRSQPILNFIARQSKGMLDESTVELTWRCQDGKHEEMIRTVYNLIEQVLPSLSLEVVNMFFAKVSQETRYDEKYLLFLKQFTFQALEKQYYKLQTQWQERQAEMDEQSDAQPFSFDNYLVKEENRFIDTIQEQTTKEIHSEHSQYGIPIFWKICLDESQQPAETRDLALNSMLEMFKQGFRKTNRLYYLARGLGQMLKQKSIVQSCKIIQAVVESFRIDQNQRMQYSEEEPQLIHTLQERIQYLDKVVQIIKDYHEMVKQKMKTIDSVHSLQDHEMNGTDDQQVFAGSYSHERTLKTLLKQIKYLLQDPGVNLGVENIKLLWRIFVDQPNYAKEQSMFINWINRSKSDHLMSGSQKLYHEMFTHEEKKFIFLQILCPSVSKPTTNLNLAKCFNTYFLMINKAEGAFKNTSKRFRVINFGKILGLDSMWEICLNNITPKARDLCQELLINVYLKQQESNSILISTFVDNCMKDVTKEGMVSLLSAFLDRYEGFKEVRVESDIQRRIPGLKPIMIKVQSQMDEQNIVKNVGLTYYQSLGHLRKHIAETFGLQQNEFTMLLKNQQLIDPEIDDDKFMKDFPGMFSHVAIKRNTSYDPALHPKFLISENLEYFERIFDMLKTSQVSKLDSIYDLFIKLPVNKTLKESFVSLQKVKEAQSQEAVSQAWTELLDPTSMFRLLYCVQIINSQISKDEENTWLQTFIDAGGFHQLVKCVIELNITEVDSMLKLKCLKDLVSLIQLLLKDKYQLLEQVDRPSLVHKLLDQIEMICDFSIKSEEQRGYSYETLVKRIDAAKVRKQNAKLHTLANAKDQKKQVDADDDGDSDDKLAQQQLLKEFKDQAEVVNNMFSIIKQINYTDPETAIKVLGSEHQLTNLLAKGLVQNANLILRNCVGCRFTELLFPPAEYSNEILTQRNEHKIQVILNELSLVKTTVSHERRCFDFYKHLAQLITQADNFVGALQDAVIPVINYLTELIMTREIKESTTQDCDHLLQGAILLLSNLLQKFPDQKSLVGSKLLKHLIHDCLFEIPHGNKGSQNLCAPKCKSWSTRQQALALVSTLTRDCLQNLSYVLGYLSQFNQEATWRTPKESDWNIRLYNDEKSATGHVGIKNLACICYMNSLNQQLFMIPGFRNDVLSIKDPNNDNNPDEDNMFLQWQTLFTGLMLSEKMYVNPKSYCHAFKDWDGNPINVIEQMDCEEYLTQFFDKLEGAIKGTPQEKTIQYHFGGELANEIICKTCPHQYERKETFLNLGLDVKNKKTMYEALTSFVQGDVLDEDNQYMCEKCDKKVDALKRVVIKKLPRYLLCTLKRFEFDMDTMMRVKVNDLFEFPHDLDLSKYTQDYLSKKAKGGEFTLKYHADYYNYELVGVVVHSGTADSGHYYSYIKEQERFEANRPEKWFEFNDTLVREFDKSEIPSECFGGVEQSHGWISKGYMKTASAYILVYRQKLDQYPADSDEESTDNKKNDDHLGQKTLKIQPDSEIAKKIAKQNHKYWQNRFLYSAEYTEFVCQLTASWNTNFVIPANSLDRNDDSHLQEQHNTLASQYELKPMTIAPVNDIPLPLNKLYSKEQIVDAQFNVFKFAAAHYISVMQRAEDKTHLPTMVKYLKTYINYNWQWAKWFLSQFVNIETFKECFLECPNKLMRSIMAGLIYCAMLQVYKHEKSQLMDFWSDVKSQRKQVRQTVLGSLILLIMSYLPQMRQFNKAHSAALQVLARFSSLGAEARYFMIEGGALEKLLNYFHWDCSPYLEEFKQAPLLPFEQNMRPEIGLPTPDNLDGNKKGNFAILKRNLRLKKLMTEDPHFPYLVETMANLARSIKNIQNQPTHYMLNPATQSLVEHDLVLFLPSFEFLEKVFVSATKPRIVTSLCKAYLHHSINDDTVMQKLYETVQYGLKAQEYEHNKIRPFLILFQYMMQAVPESKWLQTNFETILTEFFRKEIARNLRYFQWMEVIFDFIWKLYTRVPLVRQWMQEHLEQWQFLGDWLEKNKEPPLQFAQQMGSPQVYKMNKSRSAILNAGRYNKHQNQCLYYYRQTCFNSMKNKTDVDLSQEVDLDTVDVQDFKFVTKMKVDMLEDRFVPHAVTATIQTDLDEIAQLKVSHDDGTQDQSNWILTQKCKIFSHGVIASLHKCREMARISEVLLKRAELESQNRAKLELERKEQQQLQASKQLHNQQHQQQQVSYLNDKGGQQSDDDDEDDEDEDDDQMGVAGDSGQYQNPNYQGAEGVDADVEAQDAGSVKSTDMNFDHDANNEDIQDFYDGQISD